MLHQQTLERTTLLFRGTCRLGDVALMGRQQLAQIRSFEFLDDFRLHVLKTTAHYSLSRHERHGRTW